MPEPAQTLRGATPVQPDSSTRPTVRLAPPLAAMLAILAILLCGALGFVVSDPRQEPTTFHAIPPSDPAPVAAVVAQPEPAGDDMHSATTTPAADPVIATEPLAPEARPWVEQVVRRGDNLSLIFKRAGFGESDLHRVVSETEHGRSLAQIFPGQTIAFQAGDAGDLAALRLVRSPVETIVYRKGETGFASDVETRTPEVRDSWAVAEITSSLFMAGQEAGLSQGMIIELANIFGGVIDFVHDPRVGDKVYLVYEEQYLDGEKFRDGDILAVSFVNQGKTYNAFRYTDESGDTAYYNEDGVSMRKAFLLAPVDFTRVSSNFNLRRLHPIYKTTRPHRGTDYAAPRGTPVYAAGDGRVVQAGYGKANGNYVYIQHGDRYITHYLHLQKRTVSAGQRVSQGQVIGTVGSTGAATGPHLHYEFLVDGVHRDPRTVHKRLPKVKTLPDSALPAFRAAINHATTQLASLRSDNQLAMNHSGLFESLAN